MLHRVRLSNVAKGTTATLTVFSPQFHSRGTPLVKVAQLILVLLCPPISRRLTEVLVYSLRVLPCFAYYGEMRDGATHACVRVPKTREVSLRSSFCLSCHSSPSSSPSPSWASLYLFTAVVVFHRVASLWPACLPPSPSPLLPLFPLLSPSVSARIHFSWRLCCVVPPICVCRRPHPHLDSS